MHRKVRQYLKKSLCGILSAAMILTSLSVPDMTVRAAEVSVSDETEEMEETHTRETTESLSEETSIIETTETEEIQSEETTKSEEDETEETSSAMDEKETEEDVSAEKGNLILAESEEEETQDYDSVKANRADENGNYIVNGDFENGTEPWTVENIGLRDNSESDSIGDNSGKCMYLWSENGASLSMSQSITLGEGKYKASIEAGGNYQAEAFSLRVKQADDSVIVEKKFQAGTGNWGDWVTEETNSFDISGESNITIEISGILGAGEQIYLDNAKLCVYSLHTMEELTDLYNSVKDYKEESYTTESWAKFASALSAAKGYIDNSSSGTETDINTAYENLQKAVSELLIKMTFYCFVGETEQEVGIVKYGNVSSSITESENWIWDTTAAYVMNKVADTGWCSAELYLPAKENGTGFAVYLKDKTLKYQCVPGWDGNPEHYEKLISGEAQSYAVKDVDGTCILYQGTGDIVSAIERNVTLYVYSEDGIPSIMSDSQLSNVVEGSGVKIVEQLTESHKDADNNYYYDMTLDADNWYALTFSAPDAQHICDLYTKGTDNTYTSVVSFINGATSADGTVDFTPVFDGSKYYKDGEFYSSKALATGVSLEKLQELYDKAEKLEEIRYTEESWAVLTEKMTAAKQLLDDKSTDTTAITSAYEALNQAIDDLVSAGVRFYYYVGDTQGKKVGVYHWGDSISSTAENKDWIFWDTPMFEMTSAEYTGWYSVPLTFTGSADDSANFQIIIDGSENAIFKCGSTEDAGNKDIYTKLFASEQTSYAVKQFGETVMLYEGPDAETAMRNITLYAYSESGTPAIGSSVKLSVLNETTGALAELTASKSEGSTHYYNMTAEPTGTDASEEETANWYRLTFSIPVLEEGTDIGIYTLAGETYTEDKKFADKDAAGSVNITPVFNGSIYYRDGQLYKTKEESAGITLKQLKEYLESEEVASVVRNGEGMYTAESWAKFSAAKTKADELTAMIDDKGENYKDTETTAAYSALKEAVQSMVSTGKVINLYYYSEALNEFADTDTEKYGLYLSTWSNQKVSSTKEELQLSQGEWGYSAYTFDKVTDTAVNYGYDNWYSIPVKLIAANDGADKDGFLIQTGKASTVDGVTTHTALEADTGLIKISYWENKSIYDEMTKLDNNGTIAIKGTNTYASIYEAENVTIDKLLTLYKEAAALDEKDYMKGEQWDAFQTALAAAKTVIDKENPTADEIDTAYNNLKDAMDALVYSRTADINVKKVALADDFITGADLSSYIALKDSGVVFRDENGKPLSDAEFFSYLRDGGMNWVRIRIWNDPYNSSGNGYGGGNNDLDKAIRLGQMVTKAGMRVLIDFHYSDFWADPKKQKAPKAWAGYSIAEKEDAVYKFTLDSLNALRSAGVDVGMVQVGNETNNGIAGETAWENMAKLFKAGSRAVREFDKNCLVAVHFTDPQKGYADIAKRLHDSEIDYDVFGSSYYPFGHGDASNLKSVLEYIVETYGKKVMAAETSWPTTLIDGDGYGMATPPSIPDMYKDQDYGVSVQGQADEMQELISKVNAINDTYPGKSIGVFYWEPAWISPYYIKDGDGNDNDSLYKQNFDLWEKYGSGWASSYAAEYDPDDAGVWFGGSAMDNSSWFDFDGTALPTAKIYSLVRTGASTTRRIASVDSNPVMKITVGEKIDWNTVTVTAKYNDGTTEQKTVAWNEDEQRLVNTYKAGEYIVNGIVSTEDKEYKIKLTIQVLRSAANNILENPGFESGVETPWVIETRLGHGSAETDPVASVTGEDPYSGTKGLHFWSAIGLDMTVSQTIKPEAGTYTFGSYIQGGGADREDIQYAFVTVKDKDGNVKYNLRASFTLDGWKNWSNPEITGITVEEGDTLEAGLIIKSTQDGAWGTIDDFYLYGDHTVSIDGNTVHGTVTANVVKANSGERIYITVTPENGYYPETLILTGASVKADTLASSNGTVAYVPAADGSTANQAVLTYNGTADEKKEVFMMPNGNVTVGATFKSIFEGKEKISLDAKDADGRYLVQVNGSDGESPVARQFHTGRDVKPEVILSYMGYELTAADYTVTYSNNKDITKEDSKAKLVLTAKGDKFTGTREILFEIAEDTREDFDKKTIQIAYVTPDKYPTNEKVTKPADAVYYLGRQKAVEPGIRLYKTDGTPIGEDMYEVHYQNNKKIGKATLVVLPSDKALKDPKGFKEGSVTTTFTIAKCPVNQENVKVIVSRNPSYYTGKKVEHSVTVRYTYNEWVGGKAAKKTITLAKGTDYAVSYTNNVNASVYNNGTDYVSIKPGKAPTIKLTGKGNFTGARTTERVTADGKPSGDKLTFEIRPKQLNDTVVRVADLAEKSGAQAPKITVKDGAKVIPASQYQIQKIVKTHDKDRKQLDTPETVYVLENEIATGTPKVKDAGTYQITIEARKKTNYEGAKTESNSNDKLICRVVDKDHLIDNANIKINGKFYYTGEQITLSTGTDASNLVVKAGKDKVLLTRHDKPQAGTDGEDGYYVEYTNNVNAGKATVTVTGTGSYIGTKTATFSINKRTLANEFKKANDNLQKGLIQTPKLSEKGAVEKLDATWIPAKDGETGAIINSDNGKAGEAGFLEVPYTGYTISPDFRFSSENYDLNGEKLAPKELSSGDYTVSYKVGAWEDNKAPVTVTVKGKGNYSGSVKFDSLFTLTARNLKDLNIDIVPATYNGSALKPAVVFYDKETGKAVDLKLNTAYTVSYKNNKDTAVVNKNPEKQPEVTLKVKGKGWITDKNDLKTTTWSKKFVIGQAEITSADVEDVVFQSFLGKALKPKVTVKVNGKKLKEGKDFVLTYSNNVRRGSKATVQITGKGNYYTSEPIRKVFVIK